MFRSRAAADPGTMTPMIDVVFLLLIFFVWTASFQIAEELLPGTFASAQPTTGTQVQEVESVPAETEIVVIRLRRQATGLQINLNGRDVESWEQVQATLGQIASIDRHTTVVIDPQPDVAYGDAIRALDLARVVGLEKVRFVAPE